MQQHPKIDFSREIINASIHIYAYDPQCEGSRGCYLSRLIDLSQKKDKILDKILCVLSQKKENDWELHQLFNIAGIYAKRGNNKARKIMYELFKKNLGSEHELIDLDGLPALKLIAHVKGKALMRKKNEWEDDSLIRYIQDKIPGSNPIKFLRAEGEKDPFVKKYLASVNENIEFRKQNKKTKHTYKTVKSLIEDKKKIGLYLEKGLRRREFVKLASDMIEETDSDKVALYLRLFHRVKFPLDYRYLLALIDSRHREVRWRAISALSLFQNSNIRKLALGKINASKLPQNYLPLLVLNFHETDSKLILRTFKSISNKDIFHRAGQDVLDIYEHNKTKTCLLPLMELYNRSYCSICRKSAVKILLNNGVLSKHIKKEVEFDSYIEPGDLLLA